MKVLSSIVLLVLLANCCKSQVYYVQDMTTVQIAALDREKTVVLLPGGILEEHGPYLPSFCDGYVNQALTLAIANYIIKKPGWKALIFPIIPLGNGGANEIGRKYSFSGTYAVTQHTLRAILMDLSSELGDQGFKKIIVIHGHGAPNHNQAIDEACEFFRDSYRGWMINIFNIGFTFSKDFRSESQQKEDGFTVHAGMQEHSVLYYLKPELSPKDYKEAKPFSASSPDDLVTIAENSNWLGYFGSPRLSDPAFGKRAFEASTKYILTQIGDLLDDKYDFSKPTCAQLIAANPVFKSISDDAKINDKKKESKQNDWSKSKGLE